MEWNDDRPKAGTEEFERAQELLKQIKRCPSLFARMSLARELPASWQKIEAVQKWVKRN